MRAGDEHDGVAGAIMHGDARYTALDLVEATGVDLDLARRLRRAMGLPDVPEDEVDFYVDDLEALRQAARLMTEMDLAPSDVLHLARSLGLATSRMADSVVEFWADRFGAEAAVASGLFPADRVDDLERIVSYLLRRHLLDAIQRRVSVEAGEHADVVAVGFADLVGFTSLSEQLSDRETAELIERFEVIATDKIVGGGGRVVKMIGDEVMFSAEPSVVAEIALSLAESLGPPDFPSVRVGVAAGPVVAQSGDLYGPVVNLASRATMAARPGTVLVGPSLAETLRGDLRYALGMLRPHRLRGIGFVQLSVLRRSEPGDGEPAGRRGRRAAGKSAAVGKSAAPGRSGAPGKSGAPAKSGAPGKSAAPAKAAKPRRPRAKDG